MSYVTSYYHIVISTHNREAVLNENHSEDIYRIIANEVKKLGCHPLIINGVENHLHLLVNLSSTTSMAMLMREIKRNSSIWIKESGHFPMFKGWGKEYAAFSISASHRQPVYEYIKGQKEHHKGMGLDDEYRRLIMKNGLVYYDEKDK